MFDKVAVLVRHLDHTSPESPWTLADLKASADGDLVLQAAA